MGGLRSVGVRVFILALVLVMAVAASALAAEAKLKIADANKVGSLTNQMNAYFTKVVNEAKESELQVMHIKGVQLGNAPQVMEQVVAGSVDIFGNELPGWLPTTRTWPS